MPKGFARIGALCILLLSAFTMPARADDWQPIAPEDLQMKREPKAPTAAAIYLYRQVDRDDAGSSEFRYSRVKILTEEGRRYANVEIPYVEGTGDIRGLQARTIRADGSIVDFDGVVYEKPLIKARGFRMMSKSFTLPGVEIGSIIEYRYRRTFPFGWAYNSSWLISDELFTRRAVFSLRAAPGLLLRWSWPLGLPPDATAPVNDHGVVRMQANDVPAFVTEEYMPPEDSMKYRVEFIYEGDESNQKDPAAYWKAFGKRYYSSLARFVKDDRALEQEVARLVQPGDSTETRARKIYARAQQIRNTSFERRATEQELQREKRAGNRDAEDVLKHGYGGADDINWLLYGLLRAAKIEAALVLVPPRDAGFFESGLMNARQLTTNVVLVNLDDSAVFLDPGTPFMPFAILPWNETAVVGLRLTADGGRWVTTSLPGATESRVVRSVSVRLTPGGSLEGKLTLTCTGIEAAWRRVSERNEDAAERTRSLEQDIEAAVPVGVELKLTNEPDWVGPETPLVAEFELKVPGWATVAGSRMLLSMGLFGGAEKHVFEHSARVHPLYFTFLYQHTDEVAIELPAGWRVSNVPQPRTEDIKIASYSTSANAEGGALRMKRELVLNTLLVQQQHYDSVRNFYQTVRAADEEQIVIAPGNAPVADSKH